MVLFCHRRASKNVVAADVDDRFQGAFKENTGGKNPCFVEPSFSIRH